MRYAFFDVDDTLVRTKSMFSFFRYWCEDWLRDPALLSQFEAHFAAAHAVGTPREELNRDYYRFLAGADPLKLADAGESWGRGVIEDELFHAPAVAQLRDMARQGITPVFVSGSFEEALEPLARHLGVRHILATKMLIGPGGFYSGEIDAPQTIGAGKAVAIATFLSEQDLTAAECWAFGDDVSDIPMLECVGHPVAVGSNVGLAEAAKSRGWPTLDLAA
ncbi:MAG: HAD superfamily hydrolase (TIGR01490 family) [Limimaricola cinnabarinus]|jgi:HAD superfamily hydrolase (TIGR01490 family)|uniref:HAD family hydrolase n=1 Tax=Limimaricola cinnabarinus TaxID=1125964 RepID=UPI0039E3317E